MERESNLWQAVLGEIELSVSRGNFLTWFKNTQLIKNKDGVAIVGVPNIFVKNQLERKFNDLILEILAKNGAHSIEYKIHTGLAASTATTTAEEPLQPRIVEDIKVVRSQPIAQVTHSYRQGLNEKYTFENFVVGGGNELAYAACQAIVASPGTKYNPLFVYGGVGIGKTHLIQAVGNAVLAAKPNARVVYVSTEQFVQEFVDSLRHKRNTDFAGHYRSADVLVVDDVQFLAGKEKIQEEFFHTFNALHQGNRQIIMSSDKPPQSIPTLEERLRSRFAWGMTIDMQTPDFETRCAIVQNKASSQNINLATAVAELIAGRAQSNIRELEGLLNQVLAYCEMRRLEPNLQTVTAMFEAAKPKGRSLNARQVIERVAKHFQVSVDDILGPKRDKDIVLPRQIAMYILRNELHLSFPKIAHELGRKDHTTAIHSVDKIEKEVSFGGEIKQSIDEVREKVYA